MTPEFSLIICTYNRAQYIYTTLEKIARNDYPTDRYEIILVNNNSTDHTATECERFRHTFPEVCFRYYVEQQQGLSFARNRGIHEAQGDVLVFLDDDAFVSADYLSHLSAQLSAHPNVMAFGGKITPLFESGHAPAWLGKWTYSWVSALDKGREVVRFEGNAYPIGANMGFRRACFRAGEFNTALGRNKDNLLGGEEKDIFNRLKALHAPIYYFPDIEVQHVIPEKRTTTAYIRKLALGIGQSEKLRTMKISRKAYFRRLFSEAIKWGASGILCVGYMLRLQPTKGTILLFFRWYVTRGLL